MTFFQNENGEYRFSRLPFAQRINKVLDSCWFLFAIAALTLLSNIFALEFPLYVLCCVLMLYLGIFGTDFRLVISLLINCYIAPSVENNPGRNPESIFSLENGGAWLVALAAICLVALFLRCTVDREIGFVKLKRHPRLLWGFLALGAAFFISGMGMQGYGELAQRNLLLAFMQTVAFFVPYLLVGIGVRWDRMEAGYLAMIGLLAGFTVGFEILNIYCTGNVVVVDALRGVLIRREHIYTGWGHYNNMAVLIAMAIPFAFYFMYIGKRVILNSILAALLCVFAVLSCSRAGILGAGGIYLFCAIAVLFKTKNRRAKIMISAGLGVAFAALIVVFFLAQEVFASAFANGLKSDARMELYEAGISVFQEHPILGATFYSLNVYVQNLGENVTWIWSDVEAFTNFFPGRWHNTVVQMLASCGIVGLVAYLFHRYQSVLLFWRDPHAEKTFIGLSLCVILALSLLDCHLFNLGPTLFYSAALAYAEHKRPSPEIVEEGT